MQKKQRKINYWEWWGDVGQKKYKNNQIYGVEEAKKRESLIKEFSNNVERSRQ